MTDNSKTTVPGLEKGLEILELLAQDPQELSLSEVAKRLGRTVAGTQKPLKALLDLGYVHRNDQGGYFLSHRLFQLAHLYSPYARFTEIARPAMQQFAIETTESIHLSIKSRNRLLVIEQIQGRAIGRFTHQISAEEDLANTVSGRVILSSLPAQEAETICKTEGVSSSKRQTLIRQLKQIARDGFHHSASAVFHGVFDLSVPLQDRHGQTLGTLSCSYIRKKTDPQKLKELLAKLQAAKHQIEINL